MVVNHKEHWVYLSTPKCATQTTYGLARLAGMEAPQNGVHCQFVPDSVPAKYVVWTVRRNPYTRMISLWRRTCLDKTKSGTRLNDRFIKTGDLLTFVRHLLGGGKIYNHSILAPCQLDYHKLFNRPVNHFVQFENYDSEVTRFFPTVQDRIVLNAGETRLPPEEDLLTPEVVSAINEYCRKDFEYLGYQMKAS